MKIFKSAIFLFFSSGAFSQCPPHIQASILTNSLTCSNPAILATGTSTTPDTQISWLVPSTPSLINSSTVILGPTNGPPTSTVSGFYANYTVIATNTTLVCSNSSVIPIYQYFVVPWPTPTITISSPSTVCNSSTSLNFTTEPYVVGGLSPYSWLWQGPASQSTLGSNDMWRMNYQILSPGVYTLNFTYNLTGCSKIFTINVLDGRPQFFLTGTAPTNSLSCNGSLIVNTQIPNGYTLSATSGSLNGINLTNLCYGWAKVCMTYTNSGCVKCDSLLMNAATFVNELNIDDEIIIFPNPATSSFFIKNISNKTATIKIFDMEGRLEESLVSASSTIANPVVIEIKNLKAGIYFAEIRIENGTIRKKLVVSP